MDFIIILFAIALLIAGIVAAVKMHDRAEHVIIICPICHEKLRVTKRFIVKCAAKETLKEFAKKSLLCKKPVQRFTGHYSNSQPVYETVDIGCGADVTPLFLTHAFIKDIFVSADQLRFQSENVKLLIDAIDVENREFEEAIRASHQKLLP